MSEPQTKKPKTTVNPSILKLVYRSIELDYKRLDERKEYATRYPKGTYNPARQTINKYINMIDTYDLSSNDEFMTMFNKFVELIETYYEVNSY